MFIIPQRGGQHGGTCRLWIVQLRVGPVNSFIRPKNGYCRTIKSYVHSVLYRADRRPHRSLHPALRDAVAASADAKAKRFFIRWCISPLNQLASLLGGFSTADVDKDAVQDAPDDPLIIAPAASRNPTNFFAVKDSELYFIGTKMFRGRREGRPHLVQVGRWICAENSRKVTVEPGAIPQRSIARSSSVILSVSTFHAYKATPAASVAKRRKSLFEMPPLTAARSENGRHTYRAAVHKDFELSSTIRQ